jgi:hypothetical protein
MTSQESDWILDAQQAVERAGSEKELQNRINDLVIIDNSLDRALETLLELRSAAEVSRRSGWVGVDPPQDLVKRLASPRRNVGPRSWSATSRALDDHLKAVQRDLLTTWQSRVESKTGSTTQVQNLMRTLASVEGVAKIASRLDGAQAELQRSRKRLPDEQAEEALDEVSILLAKLEELLPVSVRTFVLEAARDGADLSLLTEDVMDWLTEQGVIERFRVVTDNQRGTSRG